jgi:hypothetical protein
MDRPPKKFQLDDASLLGIQANQFISSIVKSNRIQIEALLRRVCFAQFDFVPSVTLDRPTSAGRVDLNLPHQPLSDRQKVDAVLHSAGWCFTKRE